MNKRMLCVLLGIVMMTTVLSGCFKIEITSKLVEKEINTETADTDVPVIIEDETSQFDDSSASSESSFDDSFEERVIVEGSVLNIYCWNDEFRTRLAEHYPGYEEVDDTHAFIGDVQVVWHVSSQEGNAYQNNLDAALLGLPDTRDDDRVDIFLVEADFAAKYVNTDYTVPVVDIGLDLEDTANQYKYTKDVVTDYNGILKGVSWKACPGVMVCRRDFATEVFGTEEPDELSEYFANWGKFKESAEKLKNAGYRVACSVNDIYRVYSNNLTSKWVEEERINIDENIKTWVYDSKLLFDSGMIGDEELWSEEWKSGMYINGDVFSYFVPAWFIDSKMDQDESGSVANEGGYVAIEGPQPFFWGGTWICGVSGTDNPTLVADIMRQLTCNKTIMADITTVDGDFVNNKLVMEEMAEDTSYGDEVLGGQNALGFFCENASKIDLSNISADDQICNEEFQKNMKDYFEGVSTYDEALDSFYESVVAKCPWLIY